MFFTTAPARGNGLPAPSLDLFFLSRRRRPPFAPRQTAPSAQNRHLYVRLDPARLSLLQGLSHPLQPRPPKHLQEFRFRFLSRPGTQERITNLEFQPCFLFSAAFSFVAPLPYRAPTTVSEHRKTAAFHFLRASVTSWCSPSGAGDDGGGGTPTPPLLLSESKREPPAQFRSFPGRLNRRGPCFGGR